MKYSFLALLITITSQALYAGEGSTRGGNGGGWSCLNRDTNIEMSYEFLNEVASEGKKSCDDPRFHQNKCFICRTIQNEPIGNTNLDQFYDQCCL